MRGHLHQERGRHFHITEPQHDQLLQGAVHPHTQPGPDRQAQEGAVQEVGVHRHEGAQVDTQGLVQESEVVKRLRLV